jgi:hypothetical protein
LVPEAKARGRSPGDRSKFGSLAAISATNSGAQTAYELGFHKFVRIGLATSAGKLAADFSGTFAARDGLERFVGLKVFLSWE